MATSIRLDWTSDDAPLQVVRALRAAGHEAWLAGGCVRDLLLGRIPKDHDIATSATPDEVRSTFRRTVPVQTDLGVTLVLWGESRLEVTTFRTEGPYLDGRRPTHVGPANSAEDVRRRDFTINGLLLDPESGDVVDHVGGIDDLRAGILRCIGLPHERFQEDHLRILRAIRFAVRFDFEIDPPTWLAMKELSACLPRLSGERLRDEFDRMFSQAPFRRCLELLLDSTAMEQLLPELAAALSDPLSRRRLETVCGKVPPQSPGTWLALLGMPMCPWWNDLWAGGPVATSAPIAAGQESLIELLRCSRAESDGARFVWQSWPRAWAPTPRLPSSIAPLLRDRSAPTLLAVLEQTEATLEAPWSALGTLLEENRRIPRTPPPLGEAFQRLGVARGPLLGEAIRLTDQRMLDEGRTADESLLVEVAQTILARR